MDKFTKICIPIVIILFVLSIFMTFKSIKDEDQKLNDSRIWVNKEHTACHYQDTIEVNGVKYLKVYDRENSGMYGSPYLVPVNN